MHGTHERQIGTKLDNLAKEKVAFRLPNGEFLRQLIFNDFEFISFRD